MTRGAFGSNKRWNNSGAKLPYVKRSNRLVDRGILHLRCADCRNTLVKYDIRCGRVIYKRQGIYEEGDKQGNAMKILCPECQEWNRIVKGQDLVGLGKDE